MSTDFKVNVNNTFTFDFEKESISRLDAVSEERNSISLIITNPNKAEITTSHFNDKHYKVKFNNNSYSVSIFNYTCLSKK